MADRKPLVVPPMPEYHDEPMATNNSAEWTLIHNLQRWGRQCADLARAEANRADMLAATLLEDEKALRKLADHFNLTFSPLDGGTDDLVNDIIEVARAESARADEAKRLLESSDYVGSIIAQAKAEERERCIDAMFYMEWPEKGHSLASYREAMNAALEVKP